MSGHKYKIGQLVNYLSRERWEIWGHQERPPCTAQRRS